MQLVVPVFYMIGSWNKKDPDAYMTRPPRTGHGVLCIHWDQIWCIHYCSASHNWQWSLKPHTRPGPPDCRAVLRNS